MTAPQPSRPDRRGEQLARVHQAHRQRHDEAVAAANEVLARARTAASAWTGSRHPAGERLGRLLWQRWQTEAEEAKRRPRRRRPTARRLATTRARSGTQALAQQIASLTRQQPRLQRLLRWSGPALRLRLQIACLRLTTRLVWRLRRSLLGLLVLAGLLLVLVVLWWHQVPPLPWLTELLELARLGLGGG